jgi:hypothetical protein
MRPGHQFISWSELYLPRIWLKETMKADVKALEFCWTIHLLLDDGAIKTHLPYSLGSTLLALNQDGVTKNVSSYQVLIWGKTRREKMVWVFLHYQNTVALLVWNVYQIDGCFDSFDGVQEPNRFFFIHGKSSFPLHGYYFANCISVPRPSLLGSVNKYARLFIIYDMECHYSWTGLSFFRDGLSWLTSNSSKNPSNVLYLLSNQILISHTFRVYHLRFFDFKE